jgi:hypothetical protein
MCLSRIFGWSDKKLEPRPDRRKDEVERQLSLEMPMAGLDAELDGEHHPTETHEGWLPLPVVTSGNRRCFPRFPRRAFPAQSGLCRRSGQWRPEYRA